MMPPFAVSPKADRRERRCAFTLVEVLAVIAIIAVLAGVLIPVVSKVQASADAAACAGVLRQIGIADLAYVNDNNGRLPGGLNLFQGAWGNRASSGLLASFLTPYMDEHISMTWTNGLADSFVCPAWRRAATPGPNGELTQALYHMNPAKIAGTALDAWQGSRNRRDPNCHTFEQATAELGANRTWMLVELDQQSPFSGAKGNSSLIAKPVHGSFRHKLYLDAHVAREAVE